MARTRANTVAVLGLWKKCQLGSHGLHFNSVPLFGFSQEGTKGHIWDGWAEFRKSDLFVPFCLWFRSSERSEMEMIPRSKFCLMRVVFYTVVLLEISVAHVRS